MTKTLLVDGDIVIYKAAFGAEEVHEFEEDSWVSAANLDDAKKHADALLDGFLERLKADNMIVALSHSENWRKAIYPDYKAQRKKTRKPVLLKPLREYIEQTRKVFCRPTLEADDVLGILATSKKIVPGKKCIVSLDKDLLQIPGNFWNFEKPEQGVIKVTEDAGDRRHFMQTLTGDVVDNYPGCPGVGTKRAEKILALNTGDSPWQLIVNAYKHRGLTERDALIQAQIARICRVSEYDFAAKAVRPWQPPTS